MMNESDYRRQLEEVRESHSGSKNSDVNVADEPSRSSVNSYSRQHSDELIRMIAENSM